MAEETKKQENKEEKKQNKMQETEDKKTRNKMQENSRRDKKNKMREIEIEKVVLSCGAVGDELEKAVKLLNLISGMKSLKTKSKKRIPSLGVRPGLELGCKVTLRKKKAEEILKNLLEVINNQIDEKQIGNEGFSFGIKEYIEIPGIEYQRDIGIRGFNVSVAFKRKGKRVELKKAKRGKIPKRQRVTKEEIIIFMKENFNIKLKGEEEENDSK